MKKRAGMLTTWDRSYRVNALSLPGILFSKKLYLYDLLACLVAVAPLLLGAVQGLIRGFQEG